MQSVTASQLDLAPGGVAGGGVLPGAAASMRRVEVKAGTVAARHNHHHEQFLLVTAGAGRLECAEGSIELRPGVALRLAPEAWHSATFTADTVLIELNMVGAPAALP